MRIWGEKIIAFVILKDGIPESEELKKEISTHVRKVLGPVAYPDKVYFVKDVPKTRSGKIMRRVIIARAWARRLETYLLWLTQSP